MSIEIPFECDKTVNDFKLTSKGFYCGECQHHIIDLRNSNGLIPEKGSCIIIKEETFKSSLARKITYRFALSLFLVMGSSLIINNNLQANNLVEHFNSLKEQFIDDDSASIYIGGTVSDASGKPITPVKITMELSNGEKLEEVAYNHRFREAFFTFKIPSSEINKTVKITFEYFDEVKAISFLIKNDEQEIPNQIFARNRKDRFTRKRYPKRIIVGKF